MNKYLPYIYIFCSLHQELLLKLGSSSKTKKTCSVKNILLMNSCPLQKITDESLTNQY